MAFAGIDEYQAAGTAQVGHDWRDDSGCQVDRANKRTAVGGGVRRARGESVLFQCEDLVQAFVGEEDEALG